MSLDKIPAGLRDPFHDLGARASARQKLGLLIAVMLAPITISMGMFIDQARRDIVFSQSMADGLVEARGEWGEVVATLGASACVDPKPAAACDYQALALFASEKADAIEGLAESSNLILDQELASFHAMALTMLELPNAARSTAQLSAHLHKKPSTDLPDWAFRVHILRAEIKAELSEGVEYAQRSLAQPDKTRADQRLAGAAQALDQRWAAMSEGLSAQLFVDRRISQNQRAAQAAALLSDLIPAMDATWQAGADRLEALLARRIATLEQRLGAAVTLMILSVLGAIGLGVLLTGSIVSPLRRLVQAMGDVAAGDLARVIPYRRNKNEIGDIARALEKFREGLIERKMLERDMEMDHADLSMRVTARTQDLADALARADRFSACFQFALSGVRAGAILLNEKFDLMWVSPELEEIVGKAFRNEDLVDGVWDVVVEEDREPFRQTMKAFVQDGANTDTEVRLRRPDGRLVWARINHGRTPQGVIVALVMDITARKEAELAIAEAGRIARENEVVLRHALRSARAAVWTHAISANRTRFSEEMDAFVNVNLNDHPDAFGLLFSMMPEPDQRKLKTALAALMQGEPMELEVRIEREGQEPHWIGLNAVRVGEDQLVGLCADIHERKKQELALESALQAADAASLSKSQFLATMSHEIRTPLNGVLGMAAAMVKTQLDGQQKEMLGAINESGALLLTILNDVLDISKIEAGKLELERIAFDPAQAVETVCGLFKETASSKGLYFHLETSTTLSQPVKGDPTRVRQVLQNLISNAVKFTEAGEIRVRVRPVEITAAATRLRFEVEDQGPGMSPEQQARLFTKFSQTDATITRKFGGTGLGLAICKELVDAMGGEIGCFSALGEGSTFWFELPFDYAEDALTDEAGADHDNDAEALDIAILAADDNATNRLVLKTLLGQAGLSVDFAQNGAEALEAAMQRAYDVILMDIHMPVMDGMAASRAIRASDGPNAGTPIIALTADAMPQHVRAALAAGMTAHVPKPINPVDLFAAIVKAVEPQPQPANAPKIEAGAA